ncbi:MAG: tetratricopeptide repeat protein [Nitrospirae bacterium]|nr:tetratricopeptide repeat protein [Magnetococcales bacterium]
MADQKRFPEAMVKLEAFLKTNPKDPQARFLKGLILTEQKHPDEAISVFKSLSADQPGLPEPYNNLAVLYAEKGMYDEAIESLKRAIKTHPGYATAQENLGDIYSKMASQAYSKALSLDSKNQIVQGKLDTIHKLFAQQGTDVSENNSQNTVSLPVVPTPPSEPPAAPVNAVSPSAKAADQTVSSLTGAVEDNIVQWAKDWSEKNIRGYLDAYSSQFQPPSPFADRTAWETRRKQIIGQKESIRVTISDMKITVINPSRILAVFKQDYRSSSYTDSSQKTLTMVLEDGRWKILRERSGKD